jgi:hypothetical protein
MNDPIVDSCMARHARMESMRAPFNTDWEDIRNYVRPVSVTFNSSTGQFQTVRTEQMFDGTAPETLEELASALHSYLTNPAERWFEIQAEGIPESQLDSEMLEWLDEVSEIIYSSYKREGANFNLALHECYLDVGSFGTAVLCQEWSKEDDNLVFNAKPLQVCYFLEDSKGRVDTLHIEYDWTLRQIKQEFGEVLPPELMKVKDQDKMFKVIHCVYPRSDSNLVLPKYKKYASCWVCKDTKELIKESGFDSLPYHVARWMKLAGEVYGRGPAKKCLADIKMLNAMERTILKAGQKQVDPPLVLTNEGWLAPIKTSPGSLIFKEDEDSEITPLTHTGNLPWAEEKAEQKRNMIRRAFYIDWIRREQKKAEQTAHEIQDERDEMLRQLAPIFGRLVGELHGPLIARSYTLLNSRGRIPEAPGSLKDRKLKVGYSSPAANAQLGTRAFAISRFLNDLIPIAQVNPQVFDAVDMDATVQEYALARRIPRRILRSPKEIAAIRENNAKMQAIQQAATVAEPASKAVKNIADAQKVSA